MGHMNKCSWIIPPKMRPVLPCTHKAKLLRLAFLLGLIPHLVCVLIWRLNVKTGQLHLLYYSFLFFFLMFLATTCGLWHLSSPTRDRTQGLGSESPES